MKTFIFKNVRVEVISENIIRFEKKFDGRFFDDPTLIVTKKAKDYGEQVIVKGEQFALDLSGYYFKMEGDDPLSNLKVIRDGGEVVYRYERKIDNGELPKIQETPEVFPVFDNPRLILAKDGYSVASIANGERFVAQKDVDDVYLLLVSKNHKLLRKLFVNLTGGSELVRLSALGVRNSRYYAYSQDEAEKMIRSYSEHGVPLDNMVIDTDWRARSDRGIGYDVDTKLFPDIKAFFSFAHINNVEIMFNDHPEPVDGASSAIDFSEIKYREEKLDSILALGLDYRWYDRNRITKLISPVEGLNPETLGLFIFHDVTKNYFTKVANGGPVRRPTIMGNVDDILNGTYHAINSSASHRYSIQWTGDISSDLGSLEQEVKNLIKGQNNEITYINSDIGGHIGNPEKHDYIRRMQYGALSPILRPHSTKNVSRYREPRNYDEETLDIAKKYIFLRYRLLPLIYAKDYKNYLDGEPVFKSLGYEYSDDSRALENESEYILADDILIVPISTNGKRKVEPFRYKKPVKVSYFIGKDCSGQLLVTKEYDSINMKLSSGEKVELEVPARNFSAIVETQICFDKNVDLKISADDGVRVYLDGKKVVDDWTDHSETTYEIGAIKAGKVYDLKIDYFQGGGEAALELIYEVKVDNDKREVYLPQGERIDAFSGKIYQGRSSYIEYFPLDKIGLYLRTGSLIPIAADAMNTHSSNWNWLTFEYIPSSKATDNGFIYEDDRESLDFNNGNYRISEYEVKMNAAERISTINFAPSHGKYEGDKLLKRRITLKIDLIEGYRNIDSILLNGRNIPFNIIEKENSAFPLSFVEKSPLADIAVTSFEFDVDIGAKIEVKFSKN
jgi:alpha-glucosidase (family GH31 glycosyl hydrolase)